MLTKNREVFIQEIVAGKSQREAYRNAYPNCKAADRIVDVKASKLFAVAEVRLRYDELMAEALKPGEDAAIATKREVLAELTAIGLGTKDYPAHDMFGNAYMVKPSMSARLKALELLGKNMGCFTDKLDITGAVPVVICGDDKISD